MRRALLRKNSCQSKNSALAFFQTQLQSLCVAPQIQRVLCLLSVSFAFFPHRLQSQCFLQAQLSFGLELPERAIDAA